MPHSQDTNGSRWILELTPEEWLGMTFDEEVDSDAEDGCSDCVTTSGDSSGSRSKNEDALSRGSRCVQDSDPLMVINAYSKWLNKCASITTLDRARIRSTGLEESLKKSDEAGGENMLTSDGSAPKDFKPVGGARWTSGPPSEADFEMFKRLTRGLAILRAKSDGRSQQGGSESAPPTDRKQATQSVCNETMLSDLSSHPRAPAHFGKLLTYWHSQQKVPTKDMYSLLLMTKHLERTALRLPKSSTATTGHFNEVIPHLQNVAECLLMLDSELDDPRSKGSNEDLESGVKCVKAATQFVDGATRAVRDRSEGRKCTAGPNLPRSP